MLSNFKGLVWNISNFIESYLSFVRNLIKWWLMWNITLSDQNIIIFWQEVFNNLISISPANMDFHRDIWLGLHCHLVSVLLNRIGTTWDWREISNHIVISMVSSKLPYSGLKATCSRIKIDRLNHSFGTTASSFALDIVWTRRRTLDQLIVMNLVELKIGIT